MIGIDELSETEVEIYKASPDTFFEAVKESSKEPKTPLDWYDIMARTYINVSREQLLMYMKTWPGYNDEVVKTWTQQQLAEFYCEGMAWNLWTQTQKLKNSSENVDEGNSVVDAAAKI